MGSASDQIRVEAEPPSLYRHRVEQTETTPGFWWHGRALEPTLREIALRKSHVERCDYQEEADSLRLQYDKDHNLKSATQNDRMHCGTLHTPP